MTQELEITEVIWPLPIVGTPSVPWRYLSSSEHELTALDANDAPLVDISYGVGFTIFPEGDTQAGDGALTLNIGLPTGTAKLRLRRKTTPAQFYEATPGAEGVEKQLDRLTMFMQETVVRAAAAENISALVATATTAANLAQSAASAAQAAEASLIVNTGAWAGPGTDYSPSDLVQNDGATWVCVTAHTSGAAFNTDLASGFWEVFASKGDTGPGSGDMLTSQNLNDVADKAVARQNLGVEIGEDVLAHSDALEGLAAITPSPYRLIAGFPGPFNEEWIAIDGAETGKVFGINPEFPTGGLGWYKPWRDGPHPITLGNNLLAGSLNHNLKGPVFVRLRCKVAEHGFAVGESIYYQQNAGSDFGLTVSVSGSAVRVSFGASLPVNAPNGSEAFLTPANWELWLITLGGEEALPPIV